MSFLIFAIYIPYNTMANISIYSRTTKHRTSDFLILIHTRDKSQPRLLQVNLTTNSRSC